MVKKGSVKAGMPEEYVITRKYPILINPNFWDRIVIDELGKRIVGEILVLENKLACGIIFKTFLVV